MQQGAIGVFDSGYGGLTVLKELVAALPQYKYIYLGDRLTDPKLKKASCKAVRRNDGKCIRGRNGNMLMDFDNKKVVVIGRRLRKEPASLTTQY